MPSWNVEAVMRTARAQLGTPYKLGAEGPDRFDCSGLIWYCFQRNGLVKLIGGGRYRARWYARHFAAQGRLTRDVNKAQRGDLVIYGPSADPAKVTHIGIYLGAGVPGRKRAISALRNPSGVTRHAYNALTVPVVGFLQVGR